MFFSTLLVAVAAMVAVEAACPAANLISPCKCKEVMQGRVIDCGSATSSGDLVKAFSNDLGNNDFHFFEMIKLSGSSSVADLPANVFGGKTFHWLWIGPSDIATVDEKAFSGLEATMLELLMGDCPKLTSFPFGALAPYILLSTINLKNNGLTSMPVVAAAPELAHIELEGGKIATITPNAFKDVPRLAKVDLNRNPLTAIQDNWFAASTSKPFYVYLEHCQITEVSAGAFSGTLPSGLFLAGNKLTTLPEATFKPLLDNMVSTAALAHHNQFIDFEGNPLECDCSFKWLATQTSYAPFVRKAVCSNADVNGVSVMELPADFFAAC